jgi:membrane protein involved in colicin uptake
LSHFYVIITIRNEGVINLKKIIKNIAIYSMIGMMQVGLGVSISEASPLHNWYTTPQQYDQDNHDQDQDRDRHEQERHEKERHERERIERERHEHEMERHEHEDEGAWRERQRIENERNADNVRRIAHDILDIVLDQ